MIKIIVNPFSGRCRKLWNTIKEKIDALQIRYEYAITRTLHAAEDNIARAVQDGIKKVFVVGGDGSLNVLLNNPDLKDIFLGIIPAGSGKLRCKPDPMPVPVSSAYPQKEG